MPVLKLTKLMYLADRESLRRFGFSITNDRAVSMPHGPVLSQTLDHVNDALPSSTDGWDHWVQDRENHEVSIAAGRSADNESLDELSESEVEVIASTWSEFGALSPYQLRDYTHEKCPEWVDPQGSSRPIHRRSILKSVGWSEEQAKKLDREEREFEALAGLLRHA